MKKYDIVFLSISPAFYKIRLFNEIAKVKKIFVLFFVGSKNSRSFDFYSEKPNFEYMINRGGEFSFFSLFLKKIFLQIKYDQLVFGEWNHWSFFSILFLSRKKKNALVLESSIYEYHPKVIKDILKRLFLSKISTAYPVGIAQKKIFEHFNFKGTYKITGGCGILNYISQPPYMGHTKVKNFLYVGRLAPVKNLEMLINVFNEFPNLHLDLIGEGILREKLEQIAKENIKFLGSIDNKSLNSYYQSSDVFILPSFSETWGLVIEEALNNGLPVIVSNKVGCRDDLVTKETGLVFNVNDISSLKKAILEITDINLYNKLRLGVSKLDFLARAEQQVQMFLTE